MKCGQEVQIVGPDGVVMATAVSQCGGSFRMISWPPWTSGDHFGPFRNGYVLYGWQELLKGLVWLIAHPQTAGPYIVRTAASLYIQVTLIPQVRASELAVLLDAPLDEVREQLHDWIVVPGPQPQEVAGDGDNG